jgi:hypothetical protein
MGVGALNSPTLMYIMLSDGSGWSELIKEGLNSITPYESEIRLSDGSGFPNPDGYHVE